MLFTAVYVGSSWEKRSIPNVWPNDTYSTGMHPQMRKDYYVQSDYTLMTQAKVSRNTHYWVMIANSRNKDNPSGSAVFVSKRLQ
jgi:hypothetical protein